MGTMRYGVRPLFHSDIEKAHADGKTSVSFRAKIKPISNFVQFSTCVAVLILVVSLVLVAELAVYAVVGAAFGMVSKVYHEVMLPRHHADEGVMTYDSEIAEASPSST